MSNVKDFLKHMVTHVDKDTEEQYKKFGENFFETVDVECCKPKNTPIPPTEQMVIRAIEGLKSGLHPSSLSQQEVQELYDRYGNFWWKELGFLEEEVPKPAFSMAAPSQEGNQNSVKKNTKKNKKQR